MTTAALPTWRRGSGWIHAFVYFWLAFATISAVEGTPGAGRAVLAIALATGLAAWYGYWQLTPHVAVQGRVYLIGALVVWASLVAVDTDFLVAGVSVLAPYCFGKPRLALVLFAPCAVSWLWQEALAGGLDWFELVVVLLMVGSGGAITGHVSTLARQNQEHQRLIEQLQAAQSELAAAERQAGILAERQRLARDIHDTLAQGFASIVMLLEAAEASLDPGHPAGRHITAALRSGRTNLAESRHVVWALRPELLGDGRLPEATRELLTRLEEETGLRTELVITGPPRHLPRDTETSLLRVIQEALANVRKHARATRVSITISYMDDLTVLDIQDDGTGFHTDRSPAEPAGLGLRAMRERATELGGRLTVESTPGEGTTVVVQLPAPADALAEQAT